jgi:hypothetical protein
LHHIGLCATCNLCGQALKVSIKAHVFGFDFDAWIFLFKKSQCFQSGFVSTRPSPPTEAQYFGVALCIRSANERDRGECGAQ